MEDKKELLKSLAVFRDKHDGIFKGTKAYGYKYAEYKDIREKIDPILKECKLIIIHQSIVLNEKNYQRTNICHWETGQSIFSDIEMKVKKTLPYDDKQKKYVGTIPEDIGDPQGLGAAITYYNRYGMASLLALKLVGDTDGVSSVEDKIKVKEDSDKKYREKFEKIINEMKDRVEKLEPNESISERTIIYLKEKYKLMPAEYQEKLQNIVKSYGVNFDD